MYWDDPRELLPLHLAALSYARDMIGVQETGLTNSGPWVDIFLQAAELNPGNPWCAAFVNWCVEQGAEITGIESPLEDVPFQGYVPSYVDTAEENGWIIPFENVSLGDLFCVYHTSKRRYAHIGFVNGVDHDRGIIHTIEGNSNSTGSRDGFEVAENTRVISDRLLFLRYA